MKHLFLLIFVILAFTTEVALAGQEPFDEDDKGPYLIYNCKDKHWNCVSEEKNNECNKVRNEDLKIKNNYYHSCAPIEKLPSKQGCYQRQLFFSTRNQGTTFCIKDEWKDKVKLKN